MMENINEIRRKNINVNKRIIEKIGKVYKDEMVEKRRIVVEINSDDSLTQTEKYEKTEKAIKELELSTIKEAEKQKNLFKLSIRRQASKMKEFKSNEEIYEYYKLITSNPLEEPYSKIEKDIYLEYILENPELEKIIISYSELENEKKDSSKKGQINIPTSNKSNLDKFLEKLNLLKQKEHFSNKELNELIDLYNSLENKEEYSKEIFDIIMKNNYNVQKEVSEEYISELPKMGIVSRLVHAFGKCIDKVRGSRLFADRYENKIEQAQSENNEEKVNKYTNLLLEQELVGRLKLYKNQEILRKLKVKLQRGETLSESKSIRLSNAISNYSQSLENGLDKRLDSRPEIAEDKIRLFAILDQYLDVIGTTDEYEEKARNLINLINSLDSLEYPEKFAYVTEVRSILKYRNENNEAVFNNSKFIDDEINYYKTNDKNKDKLPYIKRK